MSEVKSKSHGSTSSLSSRLSKASSASTILLKKQIKMEGERAKLKHVQKEIELSKKKAELEAEIRLAEQQRNMAVAEAELDAAKKYSDMPFLIESGVEEPISKDEIMSRYMKSMESNDASTKSDGTSTPSDGTSTHLDTSVKPATTRDHHKQPVMPTVPQQSVVNELTSFLLKKDLLTSRFIAFSDQPEAYAAWCTSFKTIISELNATSGEELDLLIKWLGPESKKFATSMKTANPKNPQKAVRLIWLRLQERYGSPELVEFSLKAKLDRFPVLTNSDSKRLYELADILAEVASAKADPAYSTLLSYFDSSTGILPVVKKLPHNLQDKWVMRAADLKKRTGCAYPTFEYFIEFVNDMSRIKNDPGLNVHERKVTPIASKGRNESITSRKTGTDKGIDPRKKCPLHNEFHPLNKCRTFRKKPLQQRKDILRQHSICFKCCNSTEHIARNCTETVFCAICSSKSHPSALHVDQVQSQVSNSRPNVAHGGERSDETNVKVTLSNKCSQICGNRHGGKSCSKTVLVKVQRQGLPYTLTVYAIIDDQSDRTLAKSELFDTLGINCKSQDFTIKTCAGVNNMYSRVATDLTVISLDGSTQLKLPTVVECDMIPDNREEIASPKIAEMYPHLSDIVHDIPPIDPQAKILLLIGRDLIEAHYVHDQRIGQCAPYAQKLSLGWTLIGETCLNSSHLPTSVTVNKTYLQNNGRHSTLLPCENRISVKETSVSLIDEDIASPIFLKTKDDDKPGLSQNDTEFLNIMEENFHRDDKGRWTAPLPFKSERPRLPNNYVLALRRAKSLDFSLKKNSTKMQHALAFMEKIFANGHAIQASPLQTNEECWFLPIFAIYHPKKPDKVRMVFDSSATFEGISLNSVLLSGPDLTNNLLGILIRFRKEKVAITADIEQMFYCFNVTERDQNYLRFLWYEDNDPSKKLIEYKMTVHVFGNTPSPSVATFGLRKAIANHPDSEVIDFVNRNFYVDDALKSVSTEREGVDLLKKTQQALMTRGNLRLHKVASNSQDVMEAIPEEDRAKDLKNIDLDFDIAPLQRSLGLTWDLQSDSFKFNILCQENPFTKRGMLSTLNSLYDPIGFIAPVVLRGKILFRNVLNSSYEWDEPLPSEHETKWRNWCDSLTDLAQLSVPRSYTSSTLKECTKLEIHIFCDASETAISAVAYLKASYADRSDIGFLLGKSKLAPSHGHTIPRLELCAAVLGCEVASIVKDNLDAKIDNIQFYSDSRVVLGYINNQSRRFYTYVTNRVHKVLQVAPAKDWKYVPSDMNPADIGSRSISANDIKDSVWLKGPVDILLDSTENGSNVYELVDPVNDKEVKPDICTMKTVAASASTPFELGRFENFSTWNSLVRGISVLRATILRKQNISCDRQGPTFRKYTETFIIKTVQNAVYQDDISKLKCGKRISNDSTILGLDPFLDDNGILRVGGRLKHSNFETHLKNPIIIPSRSHIARLIISHHHNLTHHQGRHITEGAVRSAGFWIVGGKKLISSLLYKCVLCRKLRGRMEYQKMAPLPASRLKPAPPFTYVGVDMFGHWNVVTRKTRGGIAASKRWAILFSCLTSRATHIEVVDDMSSSAFINALRRFIALRGKVTEFRSDRGTNFVGSVDELGIDAINVEDPVVRTFFHNNGCTWIFNTPHSSHMGGVWERIIGLARRILDGILMKEPHKNMTHDVLVTLMAEICAILNNRPIVPVSTDPNQPFILSPSVLLTQKTEPDYAPFEHMDIKDMYVSQWKHVQVIANQFWKRWRNEYIQLLQCRRKWKQSKENVKVDDVVLLREKESHRNHWPMGVVCKVFPDSDSNVRKVEIRVCKGEQVVHYIRPVTEIVLLLPI